MSSTNHVMEMYGAFRNFLREADSLDFYRYFRDAVQSGQMSLSVYEKYKERRVDLLWVEAIESAIVPLDAIVRNPGRYIKREEDIVPIEMAREIGPESVRHLSQHTNMIATVKGDEVTPQRILNITKEESFDTYENRFVNTLIRQLVMFMDKRMIALFKDVKETDRFEYQTDGTCKVGRDELRYHLQMNLETPRDESGDEAGEREKLIRADVTNMSPMQRVERLRKILYTFQGSAFCRAMVDSAPVRSPLVMTNMLKKNPNFAKCVWLWGFIGGYREKGYVTEEVDQFVNPPTEDRNELFSVLMLQYVLMKKQRDRTQDTTEEAPAQVYTAPHVVGRMIEDLCENFDLTVDEVRRIFEAEAHRKERRREAEFAKARAIFERAIAMEKNNARRKEEERRERIAAEFCRRFKLAETEAEQFEEKYEAQLEEERLRWKEEERAREEEERLREETERAAEQERLEKEALEREEAARAEEERIREELRLKQEAEEAIRQEELRLREEAERARAEQEEREAMTEQEYLRRSQERAAEEEKAAAARRRYDGMGRKRKKAAQKRDGVFEQKRERTYRGHR